MSREDPAKLHVVICGVARNCARSIERDIATLQRAATLFASAKVLVVESDSSDDTLAILQRIGQRDTNVRHLGLGSLRERHPKRTERIALPRRPLA